MSSIGLERSAFIGLGFRAAKNRTAWHKFATILQRMGGTQIPSTAPVPSDYADDPLNSAVSVFQALDTSIAADFLIPAGSSSGVGSPFASESAAVVIKIMPYFLAWITHFIQHIIIPEREEEFGHDVARISSEFIANFCGARVQIFVHQAMATSNAPQASRKTFFLSYAIPALLFRSKSLSSTSRQHVLFNCYNAVGFLIGQHMDPVPLSPYGQDLYDALRTEPERVADLFQSAVVSAIGNLRAESLSEGDFQAGAFFFTVSYRGIFRFIKEDRVIYRLLGSGYVRWTCEMMRTISHLRLLPQMLKATGVHLAEKRACLTLANGCIQTGYTHLVRLIQHFGPHLVQQAYDEHAISSVLHMHRLVAQHSKLLEGSTHAIAIQGIGELFTCIAPYLVYHSVLKSAIRTHNRMRRCMVPEILNSAAWKSFDEQLKTMMGLYNIDREHPSTVCDWRQCPNTATRDNPNPAVHPLHVCCGCQLSYYCSVACQKRDWRDGHRANYHSGRESFKSSIVHQVITARDRHFLHYVIREVMHAYRNADRSLVRDVDLTVVPPQLTLHPLRSYNIKEFDQNLCVNLNGREVETILVVFRLPMGKPVVKKAGRWDVDLSEEKRGMLFTSLDDWKMIPMFER